MDWWARRRHRGVPERRRTSTAMLHALRRYSAAEWAAAEPVAAWDPALKAAHRRWGGGRELDHLSLITFLDLLCQLQATADEVADAMLVISAQNQANARMPKHSNAHSCMTHPAGCPQPPPGPRSTRRGRDAAPPCNHDLDGCVSALAHPIAAPHSTLISETIIHNPSWAATCDRSDGGVVLLSNPCSPVNFSISIAAPIATKLRRQFLELTGQYAGAPTFLFVLHYRGCSRMKSCEGSKRSAVGWGVFGTTIPH